MKIESLIKRAKGTQVRLGKTDYDFQPDKSGAHVCEVTDKEHIALFLAVREGYCVAGEAPAAPEEDNTPSVDEFPLAEIDVATITNKKLAELAAKHLGLTGTNRAKALEFGRANFGGVDLAAGKEKATYNDILRDIMTRCCAAEKQAKLEAMQDSLESGE